MTTGISNSYTETRTVKAYDNWCLKFLHWDKDGESPWQLASQILTLRYSRWKPVTTAVWNFYDETRMVEARDNCLLKFLRWDKDSEETMRQLKCYKDNSLPNILNCHPKLQKLIVLYSVQVHFKIRLQTSLFHSPKHKINVCSKVTNIVPSND